MSRCIPSINPNLPIPELIKILKHSTRESDFLEVETTLMDREKKLVIENENYRMDQDSARSLAKKLRRKRKKCKALEEELAKMWEVIESLKQGKEELGRQLAKFNERGFEARILKVEEALAKILNIEVEDIAKFVDALEKCGDDDDAAVKAEQDVDFHSAGDNKSVRSPTEEDGGTPHVEPHVSGKMKFGAEAGDVIVIQDDSDDDVSPAGYKTHVSDTSSSERTNKRKGRDCTRASPVNVIRKTKTRNTPFDDNEAQVPCDDDSQTPDGSSDSESPYSDDYMEHLAATARNLC